MTAARTSPLRTGAWWLMFLLAFGVAGYASLAIIRPETIDFIAARSGFWRAALIVHATAGAIALALGPLQFVPRLRQTRWHRRLGYGYAMAVLCSGVTGLLLAPLTLGGVPARTGFVLLSLLWLASTGLAVRATRSGALPQHRVWMLRSFAFTFGAVMLRIQLGIGIASGLPFDAIYATAAWLSWVPNLLLVEWLLVSRLRVAPHLGAPATMRA